MLASSMVRPVQQYPTPGTNVLLSFRYKETHDQDNADNRKHLIGGLLLVSEAYSISSSSSSSLGREHGSRQGKHGAGEGAELHPDLKARRETDRQTQTLFLVWAFETMPPQRPHLPP